MKLSRILNKAIDYLTEYPKRMCGSNSNNGIGLNKLLAPYDISEASIRHQLVSFGKKPLYSDTRALVPPELSISSLIAHFPSHVHHS